MVKIIKVLLKTMMIKKILPRSILWGLFVVLSFHLYAEEFKADVNGDGLIDTVNYTVKDLHNYPNLSEPTISFNIKTSKKVFKFDTYFITHQVKVVPCGIGCIKIIQVRGGNSGLDLEEYYMYDADREHWFLFKKNENNISYFNKSLRIDYQVIPKESLLDVEQKLKNNSLEFIKNINYNYIDFFLQQSALSKKNLSIYNNIAYYLEQAGAYKEAIYLLEKIIEKFPHRTVAYINLGDAYWGDSNKEKAKKAYQTYIQQMKEQGKESRIPKKILERVTE
jgi:tetratricopeptide (TPR) repeat protein